MTIKVLIYIPDPQTAALIERAIPRPAGYEIIHTTSFTDLLALTADASPDLLILDARTRYNQMGLDEAAAVHEQTPPLPIVLLMDKIPVELALRAMQAGVIDILLAPFQADQVAAAARDAVRRSQHQRERARTQERRDTRSLKQRLSNLEALQQVGQRVTSQLDMDKVLTAVVDAAVELTGAEEGSLLLLDESTGELYMHAARNFGDEFVRTFRVPVQDTLPGQVLQSGKPLVMNTSAPQKIKTSYLVHTLIYVPIQIHERAIGVLGVDNRQSGKPFNDYHLALVTSLAEFAAIAIENARLYQQTTIERNKLQTILTKIRDAVLIVDLDDCVMLANQTFREAFELPDSGVEGKPIQQVIGHPDLLSLIESHPEVPRRREISLEDGRVMITQVTPISMVGLAITMQDITHLKELDRIKSDFVSTVSHDLRSPLTAIMGYVELIARIGPVNDQQKEFIRRIQLNVQNITSLINDLLDLGRIEAGFDAGKELVSLNPLLHYVLDNVQARILAKNLKLEVDLPAELPRVVGNTVRLRQMISNILENAVKYSPKDGHIVLSARAEVDQIILQVSDNGPGIPPQDQPYIFDKFYRASNVPEDVPGTGLGLAIVKSIVENHRGRIWVESMPGKITTFTVVLPVAD
jgi:two-component system phosphate regulon sensor histidine kinase PhoR